MMFNQNKKFHKYHGTNVTLECEDTVACRRTSYANALVFSDAPLNPYDVFLLEVEEIERGWTGDMRIGLTTMDPNELMTSGYPLPQYAIPNLSHMKPSWIYVVSKSSVFNKRRPPRNSLALPKTTYGHVELKILFPTMNTSNELLSATDVGSRIGLVYVPYSSFCAELHFYVNGVDQGVFASDIPYSQYPLFVVVDVYGCTKKVRVIPLSFNVNSLQEICRETILHSIQKNAVSKLPLPNPLKNYLLNSVKNS